MSLPEKVERLDATPGIAAFGPSRFFNRELSWLAFNARVLALAEDAALPLLERLFLGIGLAWLASTSRTGSFPPLLLALLVAVGCEFLQQWVPGRVPDPSDFAALLIGAALVQAAPRLDLRTGRL